ncbi:uncharacterized protein [Antennarius striatus]|uniref:uncharacterized protein isoform X2 n=1 Tax=Antennarius striatus TaxID=241820 RepID=UPI0035B42199
MESELMTETSNQKKKFFMKPNAGLCTGTWILIPWTVFCVLLLILTASGQFLNSQSLGCKNSKEDFVESRLRHEAKLVYLWSGLSVPVCLFLLVEMWRWKGYFLTALLCGSCLLFVMMCVSFYFFVDAEAKEIQEFEEYYTNLTLQNFENAPGKTQNQWTETTCNVFDKVDQWQAELKCCGLKDYEDWGSSIPDSCSCDGVDNSSGCVEVGHRFIYGKPCLPVVLSLAKNRSRTFWAVMITWLIWESCHYRWSAFKYRLNGGEKMVPVIFIRQTNNNQQEDEVVKHVKAEESDGDERVVVEVEGSVEGTGQEGEEDDVDDNPLMMIPLSALRRLQEEHVPPPVPRKAHCLCLFPSNPKTFYTVVIEEGSPLLPSGAVLADADKRPRQCFWAQGPHVICVEDIVWPDRNLDSTPTSL